jgi:hypothetical protein
MYLTDAALAERYDLDAADYARWARDAREERKAAKAAGNEAEAKVWHKKAKMWTEMEKGARDSAAKLRARLGDKPPVGIKGRRGRGGSSAPPKKW